MAFAKITPNMNFSYSQTDGVYNIITDDINYVSMYMITTTSTEVYRHSYQLLQTDSSVVKEVSTPISFTGNSTVSGTIDFSAGGILTGLSDPENDSDAVNKSYVDAIISSSSGALGVEIGSYVGVGTSGSSNLNSITFEHTPVMVWIARSGYDSSGELISSSVAPTSTNTPWIYGVSTGGVEFSSSTYTCRLTWDENILSWYSSSSSNGASIQLNIEDSIYNYVALYIDK